MKNADDSRTISALETRFFRPVDAASLGVFRIVFGLAVAVDAWRYLAYGWVRSYYITPKLHFTYLYFDFVRPWPGEWMLVHFWVMSLLALLVAAGVFYRIASILLFLMYAYVFLLEKSVYMNHHYLMLLIAFLLACMPASAYAFKWRQAPDPSSPQALKSTIPQWTVWLLRFQLAIVYLYGAVAKLNYDWLHGEPMYWSLQNLPGWAPSLARALSPELIAYAIAYGGLLADLIIPLFLLRRRTFWVGFGLAATFHAFNAVFLEIGVFSYLMIGAILIFLPPDWPRRVRQLWQRQTGRPLLQRLRATLAGLTQPSDDALVANASTGSHPGFVMPLLGAYVAIQLLIPLRHLLYPGPVSWSEEGHRFAWHMKLRVKYSTVTIRITDPASGRSWTTDPRADLNRRQLRKLETFPDILLQYVHILRDRLRQQGIDPIITVDWSCSLNGRPYQRLVDPDVNLAAVERTWRPATWILPLQKPSI